MIETSSYPPREGNQVRLLVDGIPSFRRICEAIEAAQQSVWVTITFMWSECHMPDDRGGPLEVLQQAAERGVDVRLIFWRPEDDATHHKRNAFWGSPEHFKKLKALAPDVSLRWDRAASGYCQHQKSWLVDAGSEQAVSFVGGINLNPNSMVSPGHFDEPEVELHNHDVYLELHGPATADVQHNFVQRWNEASERDLADGVFGPNADSQLRFPNEMLSPVGDSKKHVLVQVQRTIRAGRYLNGHPAVGGHRYDIEAGERSNLDQYLSAIRRAKRSIYIENQYLEDAAIVSVLLGALQRDVEVLLVLPVSPDYSMRDALLNTERERFYQLRAGLDDYENFMLCGLSSSSKGSPRKPIYVHSKLMVVDGEFATVGSCNLHHYSLRGNSELNVSIQHREAVHKILVKLFQEHIDEYVSSLDDVTAVRRFKHIAADNARLHQQGQVDWQGQAFAMAISQYGLAVAL